jgi:hypothetical protein
MPGHFLPHLPQFLALLLVSTQAPPHCERPALQVTWQCPSLQVWLPPLTAPQALPHWPQFCGSALGSTQASPHFKRPPVH